MKVYAVAELNITDPSWVKRYLETVTPMVESYGGRYLCRTNKIKKIEGDEPVPQIAMIIEFPSLEKATEFYESEQYQPYLEQRKAGSKCKFMLINGEDHAGMAKI